MRGRKIRWLALIQLYGQASLMAFQFLSVTVFLTSWGASQYGEWLLLTSVPMFFAQLTVGYGAAACPVMARALHEGRSTDASAAFLTALLATTGVVVLLALGVVIASQFLPLPLPAQSSISMHDAYLVIGCGFFIACMSLYNGDIYASFFAADRQPLGDFLINSMFVVDSIITIAALVGFRTTPVELALSLASGRLLTSLAFSVASYMRCGSLWRFGAVSRGDLRSTYAELKKPAGGYFLEPVSNILQNQGLVFVTGTIAGPIAATIMHSHRLLGRVSWQAMSAIRSITSREMLRFYAMNDPAGVRRSSRLVLSIYFWVALCAVIGLLAFGPWFTTYWLHGKLSLNLRLFDSIVIAGFFASMVFGLRALMQVNNNHAAFARAEFCLTMVMIGAISLFLWLGQPLYIVGLAICILYGICFVIAARMAMVLLNEGWVSLSRAAVVTAPVWIIGILRGQRIKLEIAK